MSRIEWGPVIELARLIVGEYSTGVTLRQLFYRLVAVHVIPNTTSAYKHLSHLTSKLRMDDEFPDLIDLGRTIHRYQTWTSPEDAAEWIVNNYRRDRTEGQEWSVYLGVEKAGIVEQLLAWFGDLGIPILALSGYSSTTYVKDVQRDKAETGRQAVLLYAGDFDPSGEDIDRDFVKRTDCFDKVVRVALTPAQVIEYDLPPAMGKPSDSRSAAFIARHGQLVQVELDALRADDLRRLYAEALAPFWDMSIYRDVLEMENQDRDGLARALDLE